MWEPPTANRNDARSLGQVVKAIKRLRMNNRTDASSWINYSPDELFAEYLLLTPMLPNDVSLWGFNLVTQFQDGLTADIQDLLLEDQHYTAPSLANLTTKAAQLNALRTLRVTAVRIHTSMVKQDSLINKVLQRRFKNTATHQATATSESNKTPDDKQPDAAKTYTESITLTSSAETTMGNISSALGGFFRK